AVEKSKGTKANFRQAMMKSQSELRSTVNGLTKAGVSSRKIGNMIRTANREANKTIGIELKQAYNDYRSHKISRKSFQNKLHGAAVNKLDSIVFALRDALAQKVAPADKNREAVKENANVTKSTDATKETRVTDADAAAKANAKKSAEAAKENANATKSDKANKETRPTDAVSAAKANAKKSAEKTKEKANETAEKIPPGLEKKEEVKTENGNIVKAEKEEEKGVSNSGKGKGNGIGIGNGNGIGIGNGNGIFGPGGPGGPGNAGNAFGQLVNLFNNIDKMINAFADEEEGKGNVGKDKGDSLINFADKLNDSFSSINKAFGKESREETLGHRLGMTVANKETIGQLFNSENGNGSGNIHRISDAGEGTGNFNAVSFMSSISSGINDALESYKEVQNAEKEATEEAAKEESKEAVGVLA
ncbi:MAG: hypothetical protein ACUZ8I_08445, partial [Candidatus Scalindua sp.]